MIFELDENLPRRFARSLHALFDVDGYEVLHALDIVKPGTPDLELFAVLAERGVQVHITQDQHNRKHIERYAIAGSSLRVFVLAPAWSKQKLHEQCANLIRWLPKIADQAERVSAGAMFRVPWKIHSTFDQIPIPTRRRV